MYQSEIRVGESPDFATVNLAPEESYVGLPLVLKASDCPLVKSIVVDLPRAGSAGHVCLRGLQVVNVCAETGAIVTATAESHAEYVTERIVVD